MEWWIRQVQVIRPVAGMPRLHGIGCEERRSPDYHFHGADRKDRHFCLQVTLAGEGRFAVDGVEHALPVGRAFLCNVDDPRIAYYYPAEGTEPWRFIFISFSGEPAGAAVRELVDRYGYLYPVAPADAVVQRLLAFGRGERDTRPHVTSLAVGQLIIDILAALERAAESARQSATGSLVRRALEVVRATLIFPLTVGDVAAQLHVSREHLSRVFRRELGVTAHTYIERQRLLLACRLLRESDASVKEIAVRLGYPGSPQFSRAFRRLFGLPPTAFRRSPTLPTF